MEAVGTKAPPVYRTLTLGQARARGLRPQEWTAEQLFSELQAAGRDMRLWQSFGTVRGRGEMFGTGTYRADPAGGAVWKINSRGQVVVAYPLGNGRTLRLLVR